MAATLGHGSNQDAIDERDDSRAVVSSIFSQSADVVYSDLIARHANEKSDDVETPVWIRLWKVGSIWKASRRVGWI